MVVRGEFRVDLLARLSGHQHTLAPLRDRLEDMGILVRSLLGRSEVPGASDLAFSVQAGRWLFSQRWALNIRELSQVLGAAAALVQGPIIERAHLHLIGRSPDPLASSGDESLPSSDELRARLVALLEKHKGNVSYVARDMGKARVQVHRWMQKFSIDAEAYRS
jgi:DNA-binding NtrC family response regulator